MALKGIKVLELAGLAPGPFCGMVLADFGASVIKVDKIRMDNWLESMDSLGHGKRSIALNLKSEKGVEVFKKLSNQSDVIIDTYRKGVMERLKIGPQELMATNKRLIYARLSGYGQEGSYANMAGHDINYVGISGLLSLLGRSKEKPIPPLNLAADFGGGGLMCALGIVLALYERCNSNVGQVVDASMVDGTAYLSSWLFRSQKMPGLWGNPRGENILDGGSHFYDTYETKDGLYMCVGALEPRFYKIFVEKLGFLSDEMPQFENFEKNRCKITEVFKTKTQAEWCTIFDGTDACVTPVLSPKDAASHAHNQQRRTFTIADDLIPNPAPRLSRTPGVSVGVRRNPQPGENTVDILIELKLQSKEINDMLSNGIAYQADRIISNL